MERGPPLERGSCIAAARSAGAGVIRRALVAAVIASLATVARAESPRWGSFEFAFGKYYPNVDSEFTNAHPYQDIFGRGGAWMFRGGVSKLILSKYGSLEAGLQAGYFRDTGKGIGVTSGLPTGDETTFQIIPTSLVVTYRLDWLAERYPVPLAPFGRAAFERFNWWVTDGSGKTVKSGATNGWSIAGGLALLLDFFDPDLARELDRETGVNHTYLYFEVKKTFVNDFGSGSSWDLSSKGVAYSGGLLFVF